MTELNFWFAASARMANQILPIFLFNLDMNFLILAVVSLMKTHELLTHFVMFASLINARVILFYDDS